MAAEKRQRKYPLGLYAEDYNVDDVDSLLAIRHSFTRQNSTGQSPTYATICGDKTGSPRC